MKKERLVFEQMEGFLLRNLPVISSRVEAFSSILLYCNKNQFKLMKILQARLLLFLECAALEKQSISSLSPIDPY